jgi:hypothetical protein
MERELAFAKKVLDRADEGEPNRWHAVVSVRDSEQQLHAAQTELAAAEVKEKMFPALTKWDEHKLDARLAESRPFKTEFGLLHTDESFARSTALSVLKEKRSDKAIATAEAANKLSQAANTLAEAANETADMANTHMITAEKTAGEANTLAAKSNTIASSANTLALWAIFISILSVLWTAFGLLGD